MNAFAAPLHQDVTGPGGFMSSCAAPSSPGAPRTPGVDFTGDFVSGHCTVQYFTGNGSATTSDSYAAGNISNATWGSVGIGHIHLSSNNSSPGNAFFAIAASNGGFEDHLTLHLPGQEGQTVYMLINMSASGTVSASGPAGSSQVEVTAYKNTTELGAGFSGYDRGNSDAFTTDRQRVAWGASSGPNTSRVIDGHWTFSVPVVVGTPFDLGIYARGQSSQRSFGAISTISSTELDFSHSVLVQGISGILVDGGLVSTGYTVEAASGLDWTHALPVPEPSQALMLLGGLLLLGAQLKRLRQH
jgi:hypothetical protein